MSTTEENGCEIAVIGMACRFPGAPNLQEFWNRLAEGAELIVPLSDDELLAAGVEPVLLDNPSYVKADGVLAGADLFDAAFFGYTPREAELMDPQLRLFLEIAWEAMETGGYSRDLLSARVGVYAGAGINTYLLSNLYTNPAVIESVGSFQTTILNDRDYLPLHVSYKLNLNGPSVNVQTACSTSLVAVHLACQSLLGRECDLALAGGTSIRVPQGRGYLHEEGGILSPDGHCRAFDEKAAGTISSSGAGAVLLKRLDDAIADRDFVFATIKGTAVNNDGGLKAGFTAPAVQGQAAVIEEALAMAGVRADTVSYVETHGTGTPLGDPIEIAALTEAFRRHTNGKQFCAIGSVKTNLGHLDAAAGIAGLIKTVLALTHRQIPPSLNFERPNPRIDFGNSPFFVNTCLCDWEASGAPRCAGVRSFGIGGTNAHVVLEQAPPRDRGSATKRPNILLVSAMTATAMESAAKNLAGYTSAQADVDLSDIAFTLQVGRKGMAHRMAVVCDRRDDAVALLTDPDAANVFSGYYQKGNRPVVFVFPGQGVQYPGMGSGLYQVESVFTEEVDRCLGLIDSTAASSLRALLLPNGSLEENSDILLQDTALAQPALFVISYALARQLMHWGIGPDAMIGHSIGEYVAACLAGVMELDYAIRIVLLRGKLLSKLPQGAMLAVPQNEAEARRTLEGMPGLSVAAVNGPKLTIISGRADSIERLETSLSMAGVSSKRLRVSHAFHSEMMAPVLNEFAGAVAEARLHPPQIPYVSNVTGTFITAQQATNPEYYARHLRETVRFYQGISELMSEADRVLLEVGPSGVLQGIAGSRVNGVERAPIIQTLRPTDRSADATALAGSLARLWACGVDINWDAFHDGEARNRVPLPTYPFERQRYWIDANERRAGAEHPKEKQADISKWFYRRSWKRSPLPRRPADSGPSIGASRPRFLLFADEFGVSDRLALLCQDESIDCVVVRPGERFEAAGDGGYVMNPSESESYTKLLKDLRANQGLPDLIFHCWNESLI
ncbi:MAG TPA: type I polyketide synthase, partial [Blastocatellia bacterium]|nr:type I polyketide synthase [Blastocatellia bacterium]